MNKKFIVRQNDIRDCGICCLESIIKYYGGFIPLEVLRLETKTGNNGTTAFNLIKTAKKMGFDAKGQKDVSLDSDILLPAIAHVVTEKGLNHFVVIYKITSRHLLIMDPAKGFVKLTKSEFQKNWTNIILLFKPYKKIPFSQLKYSIKSLFLSVLVNQKKLVLKIIYTNIIITILSIIISYYFKFVINGVETTYLYTLIYIMLFFFLLYILKIFFEHVKNELTIYLNKNIDLIVIPEFINHIFMLPLHVISSRTSGEILTRVRELDTIKNLFSEIFISLVLDLFLTVCSMIFLYCISSVLFFVLCIIALLYTVVGLVFNPIIFRKLNDNIDLETDFNSLLSEKVDSIESIKNVCITKSVIQKLEDNYTTYQENTFHYMLFLNYLQTIKSIINDIGLFIISSYGVYLIFLNQLSLLSLITFNTLLSYFIEPIENSIDLLPKFQLIKLSFHKISEFLNIESEKLGKVEEFSYGDITFQHLTYSYNDYHDILNNVSINIPKYTHAVIKGRTGSGKSTLCKMINRNIDDYKGKIIIDGINVKDYSLKTLRKNILYVSQREKIFNDTILHNITLGKKVTKKELYHVLKLTKVDEIIDKKVMRLEAILYDEGMNLSGGEKQRIIMARSLLLKPKILILDESLSEVDKDTETFILNRIDKEYKDITILYIQTVDKPHNIKCEVFFWNDFL